MITRLYADNFRCLSNFELKLGSMALLVGDNGTGKSSVLAVIERLCRIASDPAADLAALLPGTSRTRWDRRPEQTFELDLTLGGRDYRYALRVTHASPVGRPRIVAESLHHGESALYEFANGEATYTLPIGRKVSYHSNSFSDRSLLATYPPVDGYEGTTVRHALSRFQLLHFDPRRMTSEATSEVSVLAADAHDFARWYLGFVTSDPGAQSSLFALLEKVVPGFQTLRFVSTPEGRLLEAVFSTGSERYSLRFDELSDGQRTLIALYALLPGITSHGNVIWIDEPVNHIALGEIQPWLFEALERLDAGGQIVLVSHHPDLIDFMAAREAIVFHRPHGGPTRVMPLTVDRDEALRASDVIRKRLIADD